MSNITILIDEKKEPQLAKAIHYLKGRKKAQAFKKALLFASLNEEFIDEFVNPLFKEDFKKAVSEILGNKEIKNEEDTEELLDNIIDSYAKEKGLNEIIDEKVNVVKKPSKEKQEIRKTDEDDFEEEQF